MAVESGAFVRSVSEGKNSIFLRTSKGEYWGGETIYGCVYLDIQEPVQSRKLTLTLRGTEKCQFQVVEPVQDDSSSGRGGSGFKKQYKRSNKDFLLLEHPILDCPGGFPSGRYAYPFQLKLPSDIPGVFYHKLERSSKLVHEALIQYTCGATLEQGNPASPYALKSELPIVVFHSSVGNPICRSAIQSAKSFFCINRGEVFLELRLPRRDFVAGSSADVQIALRNDSSVDVRSVSVRLIRVIKLSGQSGSDPKASVTQSGRGRVSGESSLSLPANGSAEGVQEARSNYTLIDTIFDDYCEGCRSQDRAERVVSIPLVVPSSSTSLQTSTKGMSVSCSYVLDIETNIPWTPSIELRLPVSIKAKENSVWSRQNVPEWTNECRHAPVSGSIAVPTEVTDTDAFSDLPTFPASLNTVTHSTAQRNSLTPQHRGNSVSGRTENQ